MQGWAVVWPPQTAWHVQRTPFGLGADLSEGRTQRVSPKHQHTRMRVRMFQRVRLVMHNQCVSLVVHKQPSALCPDGLSGCSQRSLPAGPMLSNPSCLWV